MQSYIHYMLILTQILLIGASAILIGRCFYSMLSRSYVREVWTYMRHQGQWLMAEHWENIIGRAPSSDIRLNYNGVSRVHGVLRRDDKGKWFIYDIFSNGGISVNDEPVPPRGSQVRRGDTLSFGGIEVSFEGMTPDKLRELEENRELRGLKIRPRALLLPLIVIQAALLLQHSLFAAPGSLLPIAVGFGGLVALELLCYILTLSMNRNGFEVEALAFYLSTLGMSISASFSPGDMYKQLALLTAGVMLFMALGFWLRNLRRTALLRIPVAILAIALLLLNASAGVAQFGAKNWLVLGGFSFQPSEFVKAAYIYVGAATLDRLYRRQNLVSFIAFSAFCVMVLAYIGDFGTALIFFASFLVISFMRSGSLATVLLALAGAGLGGFLAFTVKPHIAQRFATWGHVWEDTLVGGYQQASAMSAAASGGLFGKGAGNGWLLGLVGAAETDLVFTVLCEELGLIIALMAVLCLLLLAFFAFRSAKGSRSAFYAIAACTTMCMLLVQLSLNVFGSVDILPFTGVTFPFISRGGSSLISCWMLMAYLKSADTRKDASFAVKTVSPEQEQEDDIPGEADEADEAPQYPLPGDEDYEAFLEYLAARRSGEAWRDD